MEQTATKRIQVLEFEQETATNDIYTNQNLFVKMECVKVFRILRYKWIIESWVQDQSSVNWQEKMLVNKKIWPF